MQAQHEEGGCLVDEIAGLFQELALIVAGVEVFRRDLLDLCLQLLKAS